ncbi:MAG TPA: epoxide hydrolase [Propionibacteriaceae bacterium]|nr:epoxide hydrolase [Propionibacteriaceae bacterium]
MSDSNLVVPDAVLDDLRGRLQNTRWPSVVEGQGWARGTDLDYLSELVDYWRTDFDWRAQEAALNRFSHERVEVSDLSLHQIHQRAAEVNATAVVLLHGWPDSFLRYTKALPLLDTFHRVVPSLPGFGFSKRPTTPGWTPSRMADAVAELMTVNGYDRFLVSGGDVGSSVAEQLARRHPDQVIALHLTDVPYTHLFSVDPAELTEAERAYLAAGQQWQMSEGAYALIQSTKPTTAAVGLADSPAGLAAWIVEKLRSWSDCDGQLERRFSRDEVLTWVTLYWVTNTIGSSFIPYVEYEPGDDSEVRVPTGVTIFPKDLVTAPRDFAERFFNIVRWTELPVGGHFTAWEEPEAFARELAALARDVVPQVSHG